ncbi:DUF2125 domain-containing protein [Hoeflea sp. YIM 152468]|uniref:DUF2125 domain-containing protein n=1 Tax=Hoeflea sp. YIM 152468 TaxID=3031759 RepID=UPI0023DC9695|nr:DUF2125 domain-containing protein [Hoeflea sp. YIM 152468]MDF1608057.1 DUF2125 domain-containing protein [Hoeflea sp. YIM 152468]
MQSPVRASSSSSRKFVWLGTAIVAGCLLWTLGWFLFAAQIEDRLPESLARITGPNASADCTAADVRGYPFRFGLFCDTLSYTNVSDGVSASAGALRSAAQFYRPGHAVAEIDGPLAIVSPNLTLRADWQSLQSSIRSLADGLDRGSIDSRNVSFNIDGEGLGQRLALQLDRVTAHARRNGTDLDIATYGENLRNNAVPGLTAKSVTLEATLSGQAGLLQVPYTAPQGAFEAVLHSLAVALDDSASLSVSGPVQIDDAGQISGDLEVTVRNQQRFMDLMANFDPDAARLLGQIAPLISTLDIQPDNEGVTLPLTIRSNKISLGIFPLGRIPAF